MQQHQQNVNSKMAAAKIAAAVAAATKEIKNQSKSSKIINSKIAVAK